MKRLKQLFFFLLLGPIASWTQDYSDSISVNFFLLDECIITINMTPEINRLYDAYGSKFHFKAYFPNLSTTPDKRDAFVKKYELTLPVFSDYFKKQSTRLQAEVAPQVVVYDEINQKTLYSGRINDLYAELGNRRRKPQQYDLEEALLQIQSHQPIQRPRTQAIGCLINFRE